jgi:proteasome lid subunit RPN8/RPN11
MSEAGTIRMSNAIAEQIRQHGRETYPNECCGALLGSDGVERVVSQILPLQNQRKDSPRNRFELTPADVREAEERAKKIGAELLGWYHSHPDAPARPSEFDQEHAWPWYSYVIVSVKAGRDAEMNSWRLADDRSRYEAEKIEIEETVESSTLKRVQADTAR